MPSDHVTVVRRNLVIPVGPGSPGQVVRDSEINPVVGPQSASVQLKLAEQEITNKWDSLVGSPGEPRIPGSAGVIKTGSGFHRDYVNGTIYYRPGVPAFYVYGAIGAKYDQLNRTDSWLGWPTSDEQPFTEGGRVSTFQNGAIYWWPETGSIDLNNIAVRYTGLVCFGETDVDQDAGILPGAADEPYVIFGVVPAPPGESSSPQTAVYEDVDGGESRPDNIVLYRGLPYGMALTIVLMEHDFGDPNKYREAIQNGVEKASEALGKALEYVPVVGPVLGPAAEKLLKAVGPDIVETLNDALDTKDDHIGTVTLQVTAKNMVTMTRRGLMNEKGVQHHIASPLITGSGASYKVYVAVEAV